MCKLDLLIEKTLIEQDRYNDVSDQKKECMLDTLGLFSEKSGEVLDIGYVDGYADVYRKRNYDVIPFNLPQDVHFDLEGSWSKVMIRHVLEHSICPALVLQNIYDVLIDGGQLIVVVPKYSEFMAEHIGHYTILSNIGWKKLFNLVGFKLQYEQEAQWAPHTAYYETRFLLSK